MVKIKMRYDGTDSSDTMVPDVVLWWYRFADTVT